MKKELTYDEAMKVLADAPDGSSLDVETSLDVISALSKIHKDDPSYDDYDDVFNMLYDMKLHATNNGQAIIQEDNPIQLRIGYRCTNTNKTWSIRISNLKRSVEKEEKFGDAKKADLINRAIKSQQGRENLLKAINSK